MVIALKQASRKVQAEVLIRHGRMSTPHGRLEAWLRKGGKIDGDGIDNDGSSQGHGGISELPKADKAKRRR